MLVHLQKGGEVVKDAWSGLLDLVYPPHCLVCGCADEDSYLCASCTEKIDLIKPPFCYKCGGPAEAASICKECRDREYHFEFARSAAIYEGTLREAIHALKYYNHVNIAEPLAEFMVNCYSDAGLGGKCDLAIPIPIHRSRMLRRGFNQSEELARLFCSRIHLPIHSGVLRKHRKTKRQMELPFDQRVTNIQGSFEVVDSGRIRGKRILLIDDVFTTGSTLDEAARVLLEAGAKTVHAYTLSKSL